MNYSTARSLTGDGVFSRPADILDRRRSLRLDLACPLSLSRPGNGSAVESKTQNLSSNGFYCVSDTPFCSNETLLCELLIPSAAPGQLPKFDLVLRGSVEVVRVALRGTEPGFG